MMQYIATDEGTGTRHRSRDARPASSREIHSSAKSDQNQFRLVPKYSRGTVSYSLHHTHTHTHKSAFIRCSDSHTCYGVEGYCTRC